MTPGWEKLISRLAMTELAPLVRKAYEAELLVESTYEEFQRDLEYAIAHPDAPCRPGGPERIVAMGRIVTAAGVPVSMLMLIMLLTLSAHGSIFCVLLLRGGSKSAAPRDR